MRNKTTVKGPNRRSRRLCLWLTVLLFAACTLACGPAALAKRGENTSALDIQRVSIEDSGTIDMLIYSTNDNLNVNDLSLNIGETEVPIESVEPYDDGTTWLILVDSANVNTDSGIEPVRATIKDLLENMRDNSNGAIVSIADAFGIFSLKEKSQLMSSEPPTIKNNTSETRLNEAIDKLLTFLDTSEEAHDHCVLVIITNGRRTNELGMSSTSLVRNISNGTVTIYPVVYSSKDMNGDQTLEKLYIMASASCGGQYLNEGADSGEDGAMRMVSTISDNEAHFYKVAAQAANTGAQGSELKLSTANGKIEASWTLEEEDTNRLAEVAALSSTESTDGGDSKDSTDEGGVKELETATPDATAEATSSPSPSPSATAEATSTPTPEPTTTTATNAWKFPPNTVAGYVRYGIIELAIVVAIIVFVLKALKKRKKDDDDDQPTKTEVQPDSYRGGGGGVNVRPTSQWNYKNVVCVTLTDVDRPGTQYKGYMEQNELSVGRGGVDDRGNPIHVDIRLETDDSTLSRKHILFQMKDGRMMVNDCSTNGIFIGDSSRKIASPTEIHQRTVLRMGKSRYSVTWETERIADQSRR